ncbi:MAG: D-alanyl-D-alanine carboxypeptidase/D-alanyl-D-alanine-endopeptidase [Phycisphaerae bacterium]|nr:D-alanyl-D-alanine carboxypeptidase/D-alanyl-D-alanine-endopeptidase [Phycisphaerae bacterium]
MPRYTPHRRRPSHRPPGLGRLAVIAAACFLVSAPVHGDELAKRIASLVDTYEQHSAGAAAVSVVGLGDGPHVAIRADRTSIPASNQKLLTTAFIFARFGPTYRFCTDVYLRGDDLVIVGGYDPLLGDPVLADNSDQSIYADLDAWAAAVAKATDRTLRGDIILSGPAPAGPARPRDWPADQLQRDYAAPAGPLNFHNNCIAVSFAADADRPAPRLSPRSRYIRVVNKVRIGRRNLWRMSTSEDDATVTLHGTVTGKKTWPLHVAIDRPALLLGRVLAERLAKAGVAFDGDIRRSDPLNADTADMMHLHRTATSLALVCQRVNKRSINMAAECMLLAAGDGTWAGSAQRMTQTLIETYGLAEADVRAADGSGLSRRNRVTPRAVTAILAALSRGPGGAVLLESLPTAGVDGTLRKRLGEPGVRGRIRAKTGYIRGVSCLSGYVLDDESVPRIAFSVMVNGIKPGKAWKAKNLQDAICRALIRHLNAGGR